MNTVPAIAAGLLLLISAYAVAAPADRPCRGDLMKYCQDVVGQRQEMRQCIRDNYSQLSEQCQAALKERRQQRRAGGGDDRPRPAPEAPQGTEE